MLADHTISAMYLEKRETIFYFLHYKITFRIDKKGQGVINERGEIFSQKNSLELFPISDPFLDFYNFLGKKYPTNYLKTKKSYKNLLRFSFLCIDISFCAKLCHEDRSKNFFPNGFVSYYIQDKKIFI